VVRLISPYVSAESLSRYLQRQRCSPQPGMRRATYTPGGFACWVYREHRWRLDSVTTDRRDAVTWWLGDPWLPDHEFADDSLAVGAVPSASDPLLADEYLAVGGPDWTPRRWQAAAEAIGFHIVMQTSVRPNDIGPESTETGAAVYRRMVRNGAAAEIYWSRGRSRLDDPRGHCPVRTDLTDPLRCVVLAEAFVLLGRRPHVHADIKIAEPPPGVTGEAARVLTEFGLPQLAFRLLRR